MLKGIWFNLIYKSITLSIVTLQKKNIALFNPISVMKKLELLNHVSSGISHVTKATKIPEQIMDMEVKLATGDVGQSKVIERTLSKLKKVKDLLSQVRSMNIKTTADFKPAYKLFLQIIAPLKEENLNHQALVMQENFAKRASKAGVVLTEEQQEVIAKFANASKFKWAQQAEALRAEFELIFEDDESIKVPAKVLPEYSYTFNPRKALESAEKKEGETKEQATQRFLSSALKEDKKPTKKAAKTATK